jgi:antitoxin component YwqK of YwqJK toxin-antitoxin module
MVKGMKFLMLMAIISLISCSKPERVVVESYSEDKPKVVEFQIEEDGKKITVGQELYYENGKLQSKGEFDVSGERNGRWEYYFNNGQLWSVGEYKNGAMEGKKEVYWPSGQMRYSGFFKNNEKSGLWVFYNEDGSILQEVATPAASSAPE